MCLCGDIRIINRLWLYRSASWALVGCGRKVDEIPDPNRIDVPPPLGVMQENSQIRVLVLKFCSAKSCATLIWGLWGVLCFSLCWLKQSCTLLRLNYQSLVITNSTHSRWPTHTYNWRIIFCATSTYLLLFCNKKNLSLFFGRNAQFFWT